MEELNRSLEAWIISERPSPQWIYKTIMQISRFLLEFSKFTHSCPQFRRMGIDIAVLERFNLLFDEVRDVIGGTGNNDGIDEQIALADGRGVTDANATKGASKSKDKYFEGSQKQDIVRFPTPKMASGNLYLYLRWIWIQFPWLALHPAATVAIKNAQANDQLAFTTDESNEEIGDIGIADESTKHLLRVWNVKKSDPTVPVFQSSLNRKLAAIKPRTSLSSNLERNVDASCKKLYSELTAPSHIAQVRLGIGLSQKDKFRRSWQQEVELSKSIPFAYHGKRAMKSGSLFPSYNAAVKETNRKRADADMLFDDPDAGNGKDGKFGKKKLLGKFNLDNALKNMLVAGSNAPQSSFFLTELDDEIRRISHDEYLHQHRTEAATNSLIKDETDLELVTLLDRISRMKSISNKLLIIQREKERSIEELENEVSAHILSILVLSRSYRGHINSIV
ncbi:hypothetical protein EON65_00710 [archaeon]|nr:MAG: hypothetical protein EON65_00710 [archaeon]